MEDIEKRGLPRYLTAYLNYKLGNTNSISEDLYGEVPNDLKECIDCIAEGKEVPDPSILASYPICFKEEIIEEVEEHGGSKCKTPVASVPAGTYDSAQTVALTCATDGATIYYTTDGSDPTSESAEYTSEITISTTTTLKAIAVKDELDDSDILNAVYTIFVSKVATPTASIPSGSEVEVGSTVTLSCETDGATIYYTTDSSTPTSSSTEYTQAITINVDTTIKVIAIKSGMEDSDVLSVSYEVIDYDTVAFADLDTYLQGKEANTTSTPYKIKITGLTVENCNTEEKWDSESTSALGEILKSNSTKYVDLSPTTLVSMQDDDWYWLFGTFNGCTSLVASPIIPEGTTNFYYTFNDCTSLVTGPVLPESIEGVYEGFYGCTSLETITVTYCPEEYYIFGESDDYAFNSCNNLQHIYVPDLETFCGIVNSLEGASQNEKAAADIDLVTINPPLSVNELLDTATPSVLPVVTPDYTVDVDGLDALLKGLSANTTSTPYKIKITGLTSESFFYEDPEERYYGSNLPGTVGYILRQNPTKYVDLSPTELLDNSNLCGAFYSCDSLVVAPYLTAEATSGGYGNYFYTFMDCSSLKSAVVYQGFFGDYTFNNCPALTSVRFISPLNSISTWQGQQYVDCNLTTDSAEEYWFWGTSNATIYVDSIQAKYEFWKWAHRYDDTDMTMYRIVIQPITNSNNSGGTSSTK